MIKRVIFRIKLMFCDAYSVANLFRRYYGVKIGLNSRFTGKDVSFGSEPFLVEIGDNVTVTHGVRFQTHDGGVGVFRKEYPGLNVFGKIKIGNNVFIGEEAMIMYGVTIGDNVVIGAKSLVTRDIPSNSVAVGIPAKVVKSLDEYKKSSLMKGVYIFSRSPKKREQEIIEKIKKKELND